MNIKKIFIFEFVSGGGFNQINIPPSLFSEGFGMLKAIICDFKALNFEITTLLDYRIFFLSSYLQANFIKKVNASEDYIYKFKELVNDCEFCFIIAPEFSNILSDLTKIVKDGNRKILSVDLEGVKLASSKIRTYNYFKAHNVNTPKTYTIPFKDYVLDLDFILQKFNELKCSIIIKPDDGVGAENIYYLENESQIFDLFQDNKNKFEPQRGYILQEYIEGEDLSVSLIGNINQKNPLVLTINAQNIDIKNVKSNSKYLGGHTPVKNGAQIKKCINELLKKLDLSIFTGYFGIDFIRKKDNSVYLIEINPRLTTSYIGIRNVLKFSPIELILNPNDILLESKEISSIKHSIFTKIELYYNGNKPLKEIKEIIIPKLIVEIPEIITPPISFNNSKNYFSCFIATKEKNLNLSRKRVIEIITLFKKKCFNLTEN